MQSPSHHNLNISSDLSLTLHRVSKNMAGNLRVFELNGVEVQKLHSLDVNGQRFTCTLWTEWILPGGRHDKQLASQDKGFPMVDGKPLSFLLEQTRKDTCDISGNGNSRVA